MSPGFVRRSRCDRASSVTFRIRQRRAARFVSKSEKISTVTYIVLRSGSDELGKWMTERRNVVEDFRRIYGETPDNPSAVSLSIDSDDTRSSADSLIGPTAFTTP